MQSLEIFKSPGDKNEYHLFELQNRLQVLLIQDNNTPESTGEEIANASLSVNVGSFNDPENLYGMAHFAEHMVFMGSERYPESGSYSEHFEKNGGYSNAETEFEWTNFQFQVNYSGLQVGLDMMASQLEAPLFRTSEVEKEIDVIESEFSGNAVVDEVRQVVLLMTDTKKRDHIFRTFPFGNKKSLNAIGDNDKLCEDVRNFYDNQYSADRMKLVVQVKTKDNMAEVRKWVTEYFSRIPNKMFGKQDFSKMSKANPQTPTLETMPFEGGYHEIIYCDRVGDYNFISLFWNLPSDAFDFQNKQSLNQVLSLFTNKSEGSLFSCLKSLNYVSDLDADTTVQIDSAFKCITVQMCLTDDGLQNYQKVLALFFEFQRKIKEEWLADARVLDVWQEEKTVSNLIYDVYPVRPAEEHVLDIANAMIWCKDISKVIKMTQEKLFIDEIDIPDIRNILDHLNLDNCKIVINGENLIEMKTKSEGWKKNEITQVAKEEWYGTDYIKGQKQEFKTYVDLFENKEWNELCSNFKQPPKNRFIPDVPQGLQIISQESQAQNKIPEEIPFSPSHTLYHVLDSVYRKPLTSLHITMTMVQPDQKTNDEGKPIKFLQTPFEEAMFAITKYCIESHITEQMGYEAGLADLTFETKLNEGCAFDIVIKGFSQKIFAFATLFVDSLVELANNEFSQTDVLNSIELAIDEYSEAEITKQTKNNMELYLRPCDFQKDCIKKELQDIQQRDEESIKEIQPSIFLRDRILGCIGSVQVLVAGNTERDVALKFCKDHILPNFKAQSESQEVSQRISCLQRKEIDTAQIPETIAQSIQTGEACIQDNQMIQNIQNGVVKRIFWDCVAKEVDYDYGEEDEENEEEVEIEEAAENEEEEEKQEAAENEEEEENQEAAENEEEKSSHMENIAPSLSSVTLPKINSSKIGQFIKKTILPKLREVAVDIKNSSLQKKSQSHDIVLRENQELNQIPNSNESLRMSKQNRSQINKFIKNKVIPKLLALRTDKTSSMSSRSSISSKSNGLFPKTNCCLHRKNTLLANNPPEKLVLNLDTRPKGNSIAGIRRPESLIKKNSLLSNENLVSRKTQVTMNREKAIKGFIEKEQKEENKSVSGLTESNTQKSQFGYEGESQQAQTEKSCAVVGQLQEDDKNLQGLETQGKEKEKEEEEEEKKESDEEEGKKESDEEVEQQDEEGEEQDEDAEGEDETENNNSVEIFFQPTQLTGLRTTSNIQILQKILNEKIFQQLRTKEDLCYKCGCEMIKTAGTIGITFYIQSEKVDPVFLYLRILNFIDNFYFETFDETIFNDYKKGVINQKKSSFSSIHQEANDLYQKLSDWSLNRNQAIDWAQNQKEISYIENQCNFNDLKEFYKEMFTPYQRQDVKYSAEQVNVLKQLEILKANPQIDIESIVVYMSNKGIQFDDQEAIESIKIEDVQKCVENAFGQKRFLCVRVFSKKEEEKVQFKTLETLAQEGKLLPSASQVTVYRMKAGQEAETNQILKVDALNQQENQETIEDLNKKHSENIVNQDDTFTKSNPSTSISSKAIDSNVQ